MNSDFVKYYRDRQNNVLAILIKAEHEGSGISFLTDDSNFMQVAYMGHPAGHVILPHYHNKLPRIVDYTCETLVMRRGTLHVDLYDEGEIIHSFPIQKGDVLTLLRGGHGFKAVDDIEMVEIKQGPFMGPEDKTRF